MNDKRGKLICPKCGSSLLARVDDKVVCLNFGCEWIIEGKREEDKQLPEIHEIKRLWS